MKKGTTFDIYLPLVENEDIASQPPAALKAPRPMYQILNPPPARSEIVRFARAWTSISAAKR